GSDHAHRGAVQVEADEPLEREVELAYPGIGAMDFSIERQDQAHRMFGNGMGGVLGNPHDRDSELSGFADVDVVESRRAKRDEPDARFLERPEYVGIRPVVDEDANRLVSERE